MDNGSWKKIIAPYQTPDAAAGWWQVILARAFLHLVVPDGAQPGNILLADSTTCYSGRWLHSPYLHYLP
jgi:hypothetical protein